jgi:hypothetical protein
MIEQASDASTQPLHGALWLRESQCECTPGMTGGGSGSGVHDPHWGRWPSGGAGRNGHVCVLHADAIRCHQRKGLQCTHHHATHSSHWLHSGSDDTPCQQQTQPPPAGPGWSVQEALLGLDNRHHSVAQRLCHPPDGKGLHMTAQHTLEDSIRCGRGSQLQPRVHKAIAAALHTCTMRCTPACRCPTWRKGGRGAGTQTTTHNHHVVHQQLCHAYMVRSNP